MSARRTTRLSAGVAALLCSLVAPAAATSRTVATVELGPSCEVVYGDAAAELEERYGPAVLEHAAASSASARGALAGLRIRTGLEAHEGPVASAERDLSTLLPEGQPLPTTLALYQYVFVRMGDPASRALLEVLEEVPVTAPRLLFLVDASPQNYAVARRALATGPSAPYRVAFPAGSGFAAFLGVETYPAIVRATSAGVVHVLSGPIGAEELVGHGF